MTDEVAHDIQELPPDRIHPVYDGIKDWLENEAPDAPSDPTKRASK